MTRRCLLPIATLLVLHAADTAFVHVNVVAMDGDVVLPDQTVVISGERIQRIASSQDVAIMAGTKRIDGAGAFLMPGLCDMHVHFALPAMHPSNFRSLNKKYSLQFLAAGITSVRNMRGFPEVLTLRAAIASGAVVGPQIYTTGPGNNGGDDLWPFDRQVETAEDAIQAVSDDKSKGYDAIKVFSGLSALAYGQLMEAARTSGLPVWGHVPFDVPLADGLAAKQKSIEHLTGYLDAIQPQVIHTSGGRYDARTLRSVAEATRDAGVWNCPTLVMLRALYTRWRTIPIARGATDVTLPERFPDCRDTDPSLCEIAPDRFPLVLLKALNDNGARLLVGTDAEGTYVVHGQSIHDELALYAAAGLTPYQALRAATAGAAEFLGQENEFGAVAPGKLADLILLAANPLADVTNAKRQIGVMVRGRWFTQQELEAAAKLK